MGVTGDRALRAGGEVPPPIPSALSCLPGPAMAKMEKVGRGPTWAAEERPESLWVFLRTRHPGGPVQAALETGSYLFKAVSITPCHRK